MVAVAKKMEEFPEEESRNIIQEAVDEAVAEAKGVIVDAAPLLEEMVRNDNELFHLLMDKVIESQIRTVCWELLRRYAREERKQMWTPPNNENSQKGERVKFLAKANQDAIFAMPMPFPGFPRLGDCTYEQMARVVNYYFTHMTDFRQKWTFTKGIMDCMKKGRGTVKQQVKATYAQQLYKKAHEG